MNQKVSALLATATLAAATIHAAAGARSHLIFDAIPLNGEWEMSYRPHSIETLDYPAFHGVKVADAVPGYWEDMIGEFRAAGMDDRFRENPFLAKQTLPTTGWTDDTTLPGICGCFLYRRTVELDRDGRALLSFEGVRNQVHVWINGKFVAFRAGFSTPFELEVKEGIIRKGRNEIVLAVSNRRNLGYCDYVSGLTTRSLFRSTGGVSGNLELRFPGNALGDVYVTTAKDLKTFTVHVSGDVPFKYEIADGAETVAKGSAAGDFTLPTEGYEFWSPANPKRYELAISTAEGSCWQRFGIRRLIADGEKFRLNGRPIYLRGVTEHCYFPQTVHPPRDMDYYRMVTAKRKELGFNFVRFHTFVPPVEYLEATDELGMVVHIESPNFVPEPEFAAIVAFARRHPSVVIYCTGNETRIDRLAETYLEDVAEIVHTQTDALFSPMSAMRGVEYMLSPENDPKVDSPFTHNRERISRMSRYCDLFTSFQLGATSYESLNFATPSDLDAWGDAFCGKPRTSHEICIDGTYMDLGLERLYPKNSPIVQAGIFSEPRRILRERGLLDRADVYFRNSCEWMWRIRKHCFEKLRAADRVAGYDFLGDINTHWHTFGYSVGMMDEFYRLKPGETVENVLRYNSAAVLLANLGSDFNVVAGDTREIEFSLSNYDAEMSAAELRIELADAATGKNVWENSVRCGNIANGRLSGLASLAVPFPERADAAKYLLRANLSGGKAHVANEWEMYAFPAVDTIAQPRNVRVVETIGKEELLSALADGERVLLLGAGPFRSLETSYRIGMAGRCSGNYATVVKAGHPALSDMPNDGFCGWQFRHLMEKGRAVQLEADVPFDPIVDIASSEKFPIRQSALFEYRVGNGRLLVCSFRFGKEDPAAQWLKRCLVRYAAGESFNPEIQLTPAQLNAVIEAPLLSGAMNQNKARNPSDPASAVRAGELSQP